MSEEKRKVSWPALVLLWLGCIIIGAGVGLAIRRPDVGGAIGVGVGFLLMGLLLLLRK